MAIFLSAGAASGGTTSHKLLRHYDHGKPLCIKSSTREKGKTARQTRRLQDVMGLCHSASCGSRSYEFEYYNEAYRHQTRHRARAKLVDESLAATGDESAAMMSKSQPPRHPKQKRIKKRAPSSSAAMRNRHSTQLWMCDQGCCSIRWKLDYAEFQSYTVYAQVSPYVVVQDKTGKCVCVICKGLSDKTSSSSPSSSPSSGGKRGDLEKTPAIIRKACASQRLQVNALQEMLPAIATATRTATSLGSPSSSSLPSEGSITDDDDDDDGSI